MRTRAPILLIFEDDPATALMVKVFFTSHGWQVYSAPDAEQAESLIRSVRPDAVLMDVWMPGIDGITCLRKLTCDARAFPIPPIVLWSADVLSDLKRQAMAAGATAFVSKPGILRELLKTITTSTDAARAARSAGVSSPKP
ncbi:MAG: response regulator [Gemmatimonadota bacterium]|nr:response regulator [Gemmatimonadota bacterium]